jgi:hypothetical protein
MTTEKVFINWDPVLEEVICCHRSEDSTCPKCIAVAEENKKHSYWVGGDWFDVLD